MTGEGSREGYTAKTKYARKTKHTEHTEYGEHGEYAKYARETGLIRNEGKTRRLVHAGLIFALALVLTIVENAIPALPLPVPGVKFGLSNIAVMYAMIFLTRGQAYSIAILKAMFVFMTRGLIAGILSISGGILSLTVMLLLLIIFRDRISYMILSISGAVAHNVGQFAVITVIYTGLYMWAYLPVLLVSGVAAGIITATLLRFIIPAFKRLG